MTAQQSKSYRAALVRIIRNAGQLVDHSHGLDRLGAQVVMVGRSAPSLVAAHLNRLSRQRALVWERYNNHGPYDETSQRACDARCDALQTTVDAVLALFGIRAEWGCGLYPAFKVNGYEEHDLTRAIRESGKAAR